MLGEHRAGVYFSLVAVLLLRAATAYNCIRIRHAPGSCYIFKTSPMTWREAVVDCAQRHSGHLATMETEAELKAVAGHLKTNKHGSHSYYIGGISVDGHQSWFWYYTGALLQLPSSQWEEGQPDNEAANGENCLSLDFRSTSSVAGKLADVACWARNPYICEVPTPDYADYYGGGFRLDERSNDWPWG